MANENIGDDMAMKPNANTACVQGSASQHEITFNNADIPPVFTTMSAIYVKVYIFFFIG